MGSLMKRKSTVQSTHDQEERKHIKHIKKSEQMMMVIIGWVIILRLSLLLSFATLFLLLRAHFPLVLQDFYDFAPLSCPLFDLTEFSGSSLSLLISKSLAAPFKRQTCHLHPDYHISESWAKPNPKSDLETPISYQCLMSRLVWKALFHLQFLHYLFCLYFHYLWLTYKSIEIPHERLNLRITLSFSKYWQLFF